MGLIFREVAQITKLSASSPQSFAEAQAGASQALAREPREAECSSLLPAARIAQVRQLIASEPVGVLRRTYNM